MKAETVGGFYNFSPFQGALPESKKIFWSLSRLEPDFWPLIEKPWHEPCCVHCRPMLKYSLSLIAGIALAFSGALAIPYQIPGNGVDISKNGTGPGGGNGNDASSNFFRLENIVDQYNLTSSIDLPLPVLAGYLELGAISAVGSGGLTGYDYAVIHYGKGQGGIGGGGGVAFYYLNGATDFTFPSTGLGPNGKGGLSTLTLFKSAQPSPEPQTVPDRGATVLLLGLAFGAIVFVRRSRLASASR